MKYRRKCNNTFSYNNTNNDREASKRSSFQAHNHHLPPSDSGKPLWGQIGPPNCSLVYYPVLCASVDCIPALTFERVSLQLFSTDSTKRSLTVT